MRPLCGRRLNHGVHGGLNAHGGADLGGPAWPGSTIGAPVDLENTRELGRALVFDRCSDRAATGGTQVSPSIVRSMFSTSSMVKIFVGTSC